MPTLGEACCATKRQVPAVGAVKVSMTREVVSGSTDGEAHASSNHVRADSGCVAMVVIQESGPRHHAVRPSANGPAPAQSPVRMGKHGIAQSISSSQRGHVLQTVGTSSPSR